MINKRQNILYISYDGMSDPLGQSQVIPYVEGLSDRGYVFTLMSYEKPDRIVLFKENLEHRFSKKNIIWKPFRYHKRFSVLATTYDLSRGFFYLLYAIPTQKISLIHCRSYIPSILGLVFKKLYGTKFIFDMRGFWADERLEGGIVKKGWIYRFFKWQEKQFLLNADATISLTRNAIEEINRWNYMTDEARARIVHITTCCDIDSYRPAYLARTEQRLNGSVTFVYVGSIGPWHSFDRIKDFVRTIYHYLPTARFKMIIQWGKEDFMEFLTHENYDQSRFWVGSLSHNEIPAALKETDIGFFFIPPVYAKKSSSPTKMGEMLAAGIPVITGHSIGDVDELVTRNNIGYIVHDFTSDEYKRAVDFVLGMLKKNRKDLAAKCLHVAEDYFSLQKGVESYEKTYKKIFSGK